MSYSADLACAERPEKPVARDNTAVNIRDSRANLRTPDEQSNEQPSVERTKLIREAIVNRTDLSTYATNVKIITDDKGVVTLRGPVRSDAERKVIGSIAAEIAGASNVVDQLEVAPVR